MHSNFETKKRIALRIMLNTVNHDTLWHFSEIRFKKKILLFNRGYRVHKCLLIQFFNGKSQLASELYQFLHILQYILSFFQLSVDFSKARPFWIDSEYETTRVYKLSCLDTNLTCWARFCPQLSRLLLHNSALPHVKILFCFFEVITTWVLPELCGCLLLVGDVFGGLSQDGVG